VEETTVTGQLSIRSIHVELLADRGQHLHEQPERGSAKDHPLLAKRYVPVQLIHSGIEARITHMTRLRATVGHHCRRCWSIQIGGYARTIAQCP
jgi:hypothetical protein